MSEGRQRGFFGGCRLTWGGELVGQERKKRWMKRKYAGKGGVGYVWIDDMMFIDDDGRSKSHYVGHHGSQSLTEDQGTVEERVGIRGQFALVDDSRCE